MPLQQPNENEVRRMLELNFQDKLPAGLEAIYDRWMHRFRQVASGPIPLEAVMAMMMTLELRQEMQQQIADLQKQVDDLKTPPKTAGKKA